MSPYSSVCVTFVMTIKSCFNQKIFWVFFHFLVQASGFHILYITGNISASYQSRSEEKNRINVKVTLMCFKHYLANTCIAFLPSAHLIPAGCTNSNGNRNFFLNQTKYFFLELLFPSRLHKKFSMIRF